MSSFFSKKRQVEQRDTKRFFFMSFFSRGRKEDRGGKDSEGGCTIGGVIRHCEQGIVHQTISLP